MLPKPQPCGQPWLDMTPTANGRLCGQCDKEIYDFSGMSWAAIAQTQAAHGNALCGMYSPEQLKHWGQTPPPSACTKLAAATALALSLSALPAAGQPTTGRKITGTVLFAPEKGKPEPVPFATVLLAGTQVGVSTDAQGHYELLLPEASALPAGAKIQVFNLGMKTDEWPLPTSGSDPLQHDVRLVPDPNASVNTTVFSVRRPSLPERVKWSLQRLFRRRAQ